MTINNEPRINQLLTQEEKNLIDDLPQEALNKFYANCDGQTTGRITGLTNQGVFAIQLESPERIQAVKEYIEMLAELGVRTLPNDNS